MVQARSAVLLNPTVWAWTVWVEEHGEKFHLKMRVARRRHFGNFPFSFFCQRAESAALRAHTLPGTKQPGVAPRAPRLPCAAAPAATRCSGSSGWQQQAGLARSHVGRAGGRGRIVRGDRNKKRLHNMRAYAKQWLSNSFQHR